MRKREAFAAPGNRISGQLEGAGLARQRDAIVVWLVDRVRHAVLRVGEERQCLSIPLEGFGEIGRPAPITDGDGLEDVAETIDLERHRMADPRIFRITL